MFFLIYFSFLLQNFQEVQIEKVEEQAELDVCVRVDVRARLRFYLGRSALSGHVGAAREGSEREKRFVLGEDGVLPWPRW